MNLEDIQRRVLVGAKTDLNFFPFDKKGFSRPTQVNEKYSYRIILCRSIVCGVQAGIILALLAISIFFIIASVKRLELFDFFSAYLPLVMVSGFLTGFSTMAAVESVVAWAWNRRASKT